MTCPTRSARRAAAGEHNTRARGGVVPVGEGARIGSTAPTCSIRDMPEDDFDTAWIDDFAAAAGVETLERRAGRGAAHPGRCRRARQWRPPQHAHLVLPPRVAARPCGHRALGRGDPWRPTLSAPVHHTPVGSTVCSCAAGTRPTARPAGPDDVIARNRSRSARRRARRDHHADAGSRLRAGHRLLLHRRPAGGAHRVTVPVLRHRHRGRHRVQRRHRPHRRRRPPPRPG